MLFALLVGVLVIVAAPSRSQAAAVSGERAAPSQEEQSPALQSPAAVEVAGDLSASSLERTDDDKSGADEPSAESSQDEEQVAAAAVMIADQPHSESDYSISSASSEELSDETEYRDEYERLLEPLHEALTCNRTLCQPPACRCAATSMDGGKTPSAEIPQLVTLTFDDAVTALNYKYFERALSNRFNPDGCPVAATFFVSHEYTDYARVHALWAAGHEIALHSITHNHMTEHWKGLTVDELVAEFGEQLQIMEHFADIDVEEIRGMRMPLFQLSGNNSYDAMRWLGLEYDSSWPSQDYVSNGLWPYSLEYKSIQDCPIGPCPTASLPDVWVNPILDWEDAKGYKCSMVDACIYM